MIVSLRKIVESAILTFVAMLAIALLLNGIAVAQDGSNARYIEVVGTGTASAKPDSIQVSAELSAKGESAKEALKKFAEKKKGLAGAMDPMELPGVSVQFSKASINRGMDMQEGVVMMVEPMMEGEGMPETGFAVEQKALITLEIDPMISSEEKMTKLSRVIDSAIEYKAEIGGSSMMYQFTGEMPSGFIKGVVKDMDSLSNKAEKMAFADAKAKATRMAGLAGGMIGDVISVSVSEEEVGMAAIVENFGSSGSSGDDSLEEVTATSTLRVRFELK